ncbi:aromatic prenyltransferase [Aspergillus brunneoviolaceus CBS 621.78]|uniref:Aromatic prenyltransferase n=1 Tax=Aspergillus brunneoviolaceus CBS 621.78 TaxID=1450534 RepID=A0ACD1GEW6_9EURO|nr:aromatic prenyltransferase [Aspergillus brunneoviolaceus CBS 621.78]RAH47813.1 aromatic prenyltransferase [Aspergillus brunneoviolaceus CBS 621.78]
MTISATSTAAATSKPQEGAGPGSTEKAGPPSTPYQTLSKSTPFANLDQHRYWHAVAPMLGEMLRRGDYSVHQQYGYLNLFAQVIVPKLGPFPGQPDTYKCLLGGTGSVELSQNVQRRGLTTRVAFEPTSYIASTGTDPFNRHAVHATLAELRTLGAAQIDLALHHQLHSQLTLSDRDEQRMTPAQIRDTVWRTQTLLALDLSPADDAITVKEYFYPGLKAQMTGRSVADLCFGAIRSVDPEGHFSAATQAIARHMQAQPRTDLYFLSCDLVDPAATRFKLYLMELDMRWAKVEEHWTMGGVLSAGDADVAQGLVMLRELWRDFGIVEGLRDEPERPSLPGDPDTIVPFILNYEMHPDRPLPVPKFYFPLVGIPELKIAAVLEAFFKRWDMPQQAAVYRENLQAPTKDLATATDHQAWMSFSYSQKKGPYLTMYYH